MTKDIIELMEHQQKINIKNRELIRQLQSALLEKEELGQLSPDTIKKLTNSK